MTLQETHRESFKNEELFRKVILQLNKDYGEELIAMPEVINEAFLPELLEQLKERVAALLSGHADRFMQWCYRVDIPQAKVEALLSGQGIYSVPEEMAKLILIREAQKVELRATWSKKELNDSRSPQSS